MTTVSRCHDICCHLSALPKVYLSNQLLMNKLHFLFYYHRKLTPSKTHPTAVMKPRGACCVFSYPLALSCFYPSSTYPAFSHNLTCNPSCFYPSPVTVLPPHPQIVYLVPSTLYTLTSQMEGEGQDSCLTKLIFHHYLSMLPP